MLILNFKTYKQATGKNAVLLAKAAAAVREKTGVLIILCPQLIDIPSIRKEVDLDIWAQHIDPIDPGKNTGFISPYALISLGVSGTLINHSEHPLNLEEIEKRVKAAKKYRLTSLVLVSTTDEARAVKLMEADYIGYEKKELIGGPVSITDADPGGIEAVLDMIDRPLIIGSGVNEANDITTSLKLGAKGVILASAVILAQNPEEKLLELANAYQNF
jgi:triosephosphate isomerase